MSVVVVFVVLAWLGLFVVGDDDMKIIHSIHSIVWLCCVWAISETGARIRVRIKSRDIACFACFVCSIYVGERVVFQSRGNTKREVREFRVW